MDFSAMMDGLARAWTNGIDAVGTYGAIAWGQTIDGLTWLAAVEFPIPDAAMVLAFLLILFAAASAWRKPDPELAKGIAALYQAELLAANRKAQQARGELRKAHLAMERERQKRRRETTARTAHTRDRTPKIAAITEQRAKTA